MRYNCHKPFGGNLSSDEINETAESDHDTDVPSQSSKNEPPIQPLLSQEYVGPKTQSLQYTRTIRIDEYVRPSYESLEKIESDGVLHIQNDGPLVASKRICRLRAWTVHTNDICASVRQHETCKGARGKACELIQAVRYCKRRYMIATHFNDPDSCQSHD